MLRFEERVIWKYFAQMCEAIRHMHERRIMHRDLKPANIFLTLNGTVKVGDLGLGREMSEHTVEAHSKVGTPLYMSPEVLRGDGYDFRSDIWSVGCLVISSRESRKQPAMLRHPSMRRRCCPSATMRFHCASLTWRILLTLPPQWVLPYSPP